MLRPSKNRHLFRLLKDGENHRSFPFVQCRRYFGIPSTWTDRHVVRPCLGQRRFIEIRKQSHPMLSIGADTDHQLSCGRDADQRLWRFRYLHEERRWPIDILVSNPPDSGTPCTHTEILGHCPTDRVRISFRLCSSVLCHHRCFYGRVQPFVTQQVRWIRSFGVERRQKPRQCRTSKSRCAVLILLGNVFRVTVNRFVSYLFSLIISAESEWRHHRGR